MADFADKDRRDSPDTERGRLELPAPTRAASLFDGVAVQIGQAALQRKIQRRALQRRAEGERSSEAMHETAARGTAGAGGPLPYLDTIPRAFGAHDVSGVRAHTDAGAGEAANTLGAEAYAVGNDVAFRGAPSLHTAAHEAAHVVQQRAGVHLRGGVGEVGDRYEQHADAVADRVVAGHSAESLLDEYAGAGARAGGAVQSKVIQRIPLPGRPPGMDPNVVDTDQMDAQQLQAWANWHRQQYENWGNVARDHYRDAANEVRRRLETPEIDEELHPEKREFRELREEASNLIVRQGVAEAKQLIEQFRNEQAPQNGYRFKGVQSGKNNIADRLVAIVDEPFKINQKDYPICGAAALLHTVCLHRPDLYIQYVLDLMRTGDGSIGQLDVHAPKGVRKKTPAINGRKINIEDWVAMASLRGSENKLYRKIGRMNGKGGLLNPGNLHNGIRGGTSTKESRKWMDKVGFTGTHSTSNDTRASLFSLSQVDSVKLLALGQRFGTEEVLLMVNGASINANMQSQPVKKSGMDHVVRLASRVREVQNVVYFRLWSWGKEFEVQLPSGDVGKMIYGYARGTPGFLAQQHNNAVNHPVNPNPGNDSASDSESSQDPKDTTADNSEEQLAPTVQSQNDNQDD